MRDAKHIFDFFKIWHGTARWTGRDYMYLVRKSRHPQLFRHRCPFWSHSHDKKQRCHAQNFGHGCLFSGVPCPKRLSCKWAYCWTATTPLENLHRSINQVGSHIFFTFYQWQNGRIVTKSTTNRIFQTKNEQFVDKLMFVRTLHYTSDKLLRNLFTSLISLEQQATFESK